MVLMRGAVRERDLERELERDREIHAAVRAGGFRKVVGRRYGMSAVEVDEIVRRIDAANRAIEVAGETARRMATRTPPGDVGWSARLRNCLVTDLGIPEARLRDAPYLAEMLSRHDILQTSRMGKGSVARVEEFLSAHGLALRDR